MANRAFYQTINSLVNRFTFIEGNFVVGSSGAVGTVKGGGVTSVTHAGTGAYVIKLDDAYNRYLGGSAALIAIPGSPNNDGSFNSGAINQIDALGTQTGTWTLTSPVSGHVYGVTIGGNTAKIVSQGIASAEAVAMAMLSNGQYVTVVPAVAGSSFGTYVVAVPTVVLAAASVSGGPFTINELCTGGTSGATGYITSAANASPVTLVQVAPGPAGSGFVVGETVTGGTSSASIVVTGVTFSGIQYQVNTYPADNFLPVANIANLVNAQASGITVVYTYSAPAGSPTKVPNPAITTVATNSAGSAAAFAHATMPATDWYAVGLSPGLTPTPNQAWLFTGAGGAGDGTAYAVSATNTAAMAFQVQGDPNLTIIDPSGGTLVLLVRSDVGALVDPPTGSVVGFFMFLRNSTIKGQGE